MDNGTTAQIAAPTPTPPSAIPAGTPPAAANILTITNPGSTVQLTAGFSLNVTTLSIANGGTFHLSGALTVSNPVEIGAGGTFQASSSGTKNTIDFHDNGTFLFDGSNILRSNVSGTGQLVITGTGTVLTVSSVSNTYSGATTLNAGTELVAGSATGLSPNSAFIVNGTLDINEFNSTIGSLSGTGTVLNNGAGIAILNVGNDGTNTIFNGVLADGKSALELTKSGTGTLTLAGNNTYTGHTTINAGVLSISQDANLGTPPVTPVANQLTFNGGSLQATASFTLNPNRGVTLNAGATFDVTDANVLTIAGVITGPGSLTETGTGTLIVAGVNTYTGITTINGGVLSISQDANLGTLPGTPVANQLTFNGGSLQATASFTLNANRGVTLNAGGTFDVTDANTLTIAGVITGRGSLTKIDTGNLILTGVNTYTGITTINAGVLSISQDANLGTSPGMSVANQLTFNGGSLQATASFALNPNRGVTLNAGGTFDVTDANALTIAGVITGRGSLTKIDTGNLILTANNTYAGSTIISAGTLQIGNGGTTGSITGNVTDNGVLVFNRGNDVTFPGVISGDGSLVQQGSGVLTLPGIYTYTGRTTVNNGTLIVDGSIASPQTLVNSGGTLGGRGTIGGNLVNNGTVSQLSSPETLHIGGDYIQTAGGTLKIGVGGLAADQHDSLAVNGHVTLGGTLQVSNIGTFSLQPGNQFVFITAGKGVDGNFGTVLTGTIVQATVITQANDVLLEAKQGSFAQTPGVATTPNQLAVAKALDSAAGDPRAAELFAFLNSQPLANLPHDLELIAPTQITSINATAVSLGQVQIANLAQRLANIREGSSGFSSSGFAISGPTLSFGEGFAGVSGPEGKSAPPVFAPGPTNRWGVFVTGLGEFTNVNGNFNAPGYDLDTGGFTLGVDYRLTPNFAIGLTAGYAHTSIHPDGGGNIDVNGGKIGLYATAFANGFYLDTAVSGGPSGYNTKRTALGGTASGSTDGGDVNVLVAGGYDWTYGNLTIGPTASFQFSYVGFLGFTETGSLAPLTFPDQNSESERSAFGARASYEWKVGHATVIPQLSAAWQHEYGTTEYAVVASFANGAGNSFTVHGPPIGRDSMLIGAGATVIWNDRVSTYLYYDGEVLRTNYQSNNVTGGVRISF